MVNQSKKVNTKTYSLAVGPNFRKAIHQVEDDYLASCAAKRNGKAYGFFYYNGSMKNVERVIPKIVLKTETPWQMDFQVSTVRGLKTGGDSALVDIAEEAERNHMSHVIEATLPDMKNVRAANYLGNVMIGIYSELYGKKEPFNAGIVYKRGDKYVFRRD